MTSTSSTSFPYQAKVLIRYKSPPGQESFTLLKDELLTIESGDEDWLSGKNIQGMTISIPASFVEMIESEVPAAVVEVVSEDKVVDENSVEDKKVEVVEKKEELEKESPSIVEQPITTSSTSDSATVTSSVESTQESPASAKDSTPSEPTTTTSIPSIPISTPLIIPTTPTVPTPSPSVPAAITSTPTSIPSSSTLSSPPTSSKSIPDLPIKPMSLKERIAALNASGAGALSPSSGPPAPKPKPAYVRKIPSPSTSIPTSTIGSTTTTIPSNSTPSSPSVISSSIPTTTSSAPVIAEKSSFTSAMNPTDAAESIGKGGGSLKDRIAALQGLKLDSTNVPLPGRAPIRTWKRKEVEPEPEVEAQATTVVEGEEKVEAEGDKIAKVEGVAEGKNLDDGTVSGTEVTTQQTISTPNTSASTELSLPTNELESPISPATSTSTPIVISESTPTEPTPTESTDSKLEPELTTEEGIPATEEETEEIKKAALIKRMASLGGQRVGMSMPALPKKAAPPRRRVATPVIVAEPANDLVESSEKEEVVEPVQVKKEIEEVKEVPLLAEPIEVKPAIQVEAVIPAALAEAGADKPIHLSVEPKLQGLKIEKVEETQLEDIQNSMMESNRDQNLELTATTLPPITTTATDAVLSEDPEHGNKLSESSTDPISELDTHLVANEDINQSPDSPISPLSYAIQQVLNPTSPTPPTRQVSIPIPVDVVESISSPSDIELTEAVDKEEEDEEVMEDENETIEADDIEEDEVVVASDESFELINELTPEEIKENEEESQISELEPIATSLPPLPTNLLPASTRPPVPTGRPAVPTSFSQPLPVEKEEIVTKLPSRLPPTRPVVSIPAIVSRPIELTEDGEVSSVASRREAMEELELKSPISPREEIETKEVEYDDVEEVKDENQEEEQEEEDPEVVRRAALAKRMAALGGMNMRMGPMMPPIGGLRKPLKKSTSEAESIASVEAAEESSPTARRVGGIPTGGVSMLGMMPPRLPQLPPPLPPAEDKESDEFSTVADSVEVENQSLPPPLPKGRPPIPPSPSNSLPPTRSIPSPQISQDLPPPLPSGRPNLPPVRQYVEEPMEFDTEEIIDYPEEDVEEEESKEVVNNLPRGSSISSFQSITSSTRSIPIASSISPSSNSQPQSTHNEEESLPTLPSKHSRSRSVATERSFAQSERSTSGNVKARDLDVTSPWWLNKPFGPPVSTIQRADCIFSVSELETQGHHNNEIEIIYDDFSKSLISVAFNDSDPSNASIDQSHSLPPSFPSNSTLLNYSSKLGSQIFASAHRKNVKYSSSSDFLSECFSRAEEILKPIGFTYGVNVFNVTHSETGTKNVGKPTISQVDEPRSGDIIKFTEAKFKHNLSTIKLGSRETPHVAVVESWDEKKRKVKILEVGKDGLVEESGYRIEELKGGKVDIFRVVARSYLD